MNVFIFLLPIISFNEKSEKRKKVNEVVHINQTLNYAKNMAMPSHLKKYHANHGRPLRGFFFSFLFLYQDSCTNISCHPLISFHFMIHVN